MLKRCFILILVAICFYRCEKPIKQSKIDQYFENKLIKNKLIGNFEEDSENGYIKIGNFLNVNRKNAIVISFDTITSLKVYELRKNQWLKIFQQNNVDIARIFAIQTFVEDYNFDGIKDIAIKNQVSNGTAIMTFHLWLSEGNTFKYIPEFKEIGNPTIIEKLKIIKGFKACCAFTEISISDYHWSKTKLNKVSELNIGNYVYGVKARQKDLIKKVDKTITLTIKEITEIINNYSENWKVKDTTTNSH